MIKDNAMKPIFWQIPTIPPDIIATLPEKRAELERRLQAIAAQYPQAVLASSLAVEDMLLTDAIARLALPIRVVTLNTGYLNPETETLIAEVQARYLIDFEVYYPNQVATEAFEKTHGMASIYEARERRRECCHIRKIEPLNRALQHAPAWLTGQRRSQAASRSELAFAEEDDQRHIAKFNPIFDWQELDVWAYAQAHQVPLNTLYFQGYPSIGCEPCTRPVKKDEDIRAGRWWWEQSESKECGLHA